VQGLLDWFQVDLGFTELSIIQIDCVFGVILFSTAVLVLLWTFHILAHIFTSQLYHIYVSRVCEYIYVQNISRDMFCREISTCIYIYVNFSRVCEYMYVQGISFSQQSH